MANAKVLLVDDEVEFTDVLAARLRNRDLDVYTAKDGFEALKLAERTTFDAVVLDMRMPEMDGLETLQKLLEINADLQIILLTGHGSLPDGVQAIKMGAMDFLEKPADIEQLMERIRKAKETMTIIADQKLEDRIGDILKKRGW